MFRGRPCRRFSVAAVVRVSEGLRWREAQEPPKSEGSAFYVCTGAPFRVKQALFVLVLDSKGWGVWGGSYCYEPCWGVWVLSQGHVVVESV